MKANLRVCRFCLANKPRKNITELNAMKNGVNKSCTEIIHFCLGIKMEEDSKLSAKLCVKCYRKTLGFYEFKTQALKSEAHLKSLDENSLSIELKEEDPREKIKQEIETVDSNDVIDNGIESDVRYDETEIEIKDEPKSGERSDDELLSVIQKIKYEYIEAKEGTEFVPIRRRKGRPKKLKAIRIKIPKSKQDMKVGPMKICEACGKYVRDLKAHALTHVPLDQRNLYKCEICDKYFASVQSKSKHKKRRHFAVKRECPVCHKMVLNMSVHMKLHNPNEFKYECAPCGRRFVSKSRLDLHVSVHTKDRPYECDICQSKFRLKLGLNMHIRRIHDKERSHLCQYCSKSFFKKHHLQVHLRSHTKERPHSCSTCNKAFSSSTTLKNHMLIHSDVKTHACTLCDMSFVRVAYLNAHMLSHTKVKRFPCQYCGARFHRSDHRKRHEFTAHLKHTSSSTP